MDRAYKRDIPRHRKALEDFKRELADVVTKTDWTTLRIDPLLEHVTKLEGSRQSPQFAREIARLGADGGRETVGLPDGRTVAAARRGDSGMRRQSRAPASTFRRRDQRDATTSSGRM